MFIAYVFKFKGVFYFSYFVNVLGAIFAIVMPNTESHANHVRTIHFWYNHIYAFALPILGVGLGVYERPNLKVMLRAIGFFTIYFLTTVILNAWFNSAQFTDMRYGTTVDYFFTYSDFFVDKITAVKPIYEMEWFVKVGDYTWKFMPLYQFLIYIVFIILMFVIWLIYDYLYQVSDRHGHLLSVKLMQRKQNLELKKLATVNNVVEPINKNAVKMIKIEHFTKQYADADKPSVSDFSLEVHDGEVFGFIGHNGSGKSTTIKSIVGIQSLTEGSIFIDGYDITTQPIEAKARIGYVSDNHAVYEMLTGREYINYVADLYSVSQEDRDERIEKYIKMFNLADSIDNEIKSYSHGMKQKIVVIASLIHNPKIWILDEPLTGLDPTSAYQIKECMREHANNGNIVFFSSHVIEVVEKICDRICIIKKGKLMGTYTLSELAEEGITLEQLFLKHVAQSEDTETSKE
jgi:ABC-2 type transport system ATP-binding protein